MSVTYEEISKTQATLEENFKLIEASFSEARKKITARRITILDAIHKEQKEEAGKLAIISQSLHALISPTEPPKKQL